MTPNHIGPDPKDPRATLIEVAATVVKELRPGREDRPVQLSDRLDRDLGLDSLARVELISRTERAFHKSLPDRIVYETETLEDLLIAVTGSPAGIERKPGPERALPERLGAVGLPDHAQTLPAMLRWHAETHPDRSHIRFYEDDGEDGVLSYAGLYDDASSVARGLQETGVEPGARVILMLPTGRDYFASFFGSLLAGAVPVPIYPPAARSQLKEHIERHSAIIANCGARVFITVEEGLAMARLLKARVTSMRTVTTAEALRTDAPVLQPDVKPDDIAFIQYTSGSTGDPKGVMLSHVNILANIRADGAAIRATPADVFVSWLPLYHDMGLIGAWLGSLYFGVPLVIMSPLSFLTRPERWLLAIQRYGGTLSAAPNFAYERCLSQISDEQIEGLDLSSWRLAFNGAEAVNPDTVERFCARFARYGFRREAMFPVYGLAECTVGLTFPPLGQGALIDRVARRTMIEEGRAVPASDDDNPLRFVACGRPLPGHEIRVVDESGRPVPERRQGRLQFRGLSATQGYYNNPEATRRLFHGEWLETGDLAYLAKGNLYITGRIKDIIIRAGRNIYPEEIEQTVASVPGIRRGRVVAFGSSDGPQGTERLVVVAETREKRDEARSQLERSINDRVSTIIGQPPDLVVLARPGTVLKTSSGKLRRAACRRLFEDGHLGRSAAPPWWQLTQAALSSLKPTLRRANRWARDSVFAGYAWTLFGILAVLTWMAILVLPGYAARWRVGHAMARALARLAGTSLSVIGLDKLPAAETGCILVSNHESYLDPFALGAAVPRPLIFLAKAELRRRPLVRFALERIDTEFVDREDVEASLSVLEGVRRATERGRWPLFFSEGALSGIQGLQPFRMGAFVTAARTGIAVVPLAISGTRSMLKPDVWFPRRGAIRVTVGDPIFPDAATTDPSAIWQSAIRLRDAARAHILRYSSGPDLSP